MARPTLHEVAVAAGVSIASASRALSGGVASARTVAKVRTAARELGYSPDATARALRTGAPRRITFAVDDIGNPNYVAMLRAIEASMGRGGPAVSVVSTGSSEQSVDLVRHAATVADGIIISPIRVNDRLRRAIANSPIPIVVIGSLGDDAPVDVVHVDSAKGIGAAVAHVTSLGRRSLVFLNGPLDTNPGSSRERGFYRAVRAAGIDPERCRQVLAGDFTVTAARAVAAELFARWRQLRPVDRPDAIIAANDLIAIGAMNAATDAGLRIPEDIMFTGVDDTEIAAAYNPSLTSVSLEAAERGRIAADLLLRRFDEPNRPHHLISVEPRLVIRRSTTLGTAEVLAS